MTFPRRAPLFALLFFNVLFSAARAAAPVSIRTIAGSTDGFADGGFADGAASSSKFSYPAGVAVVPGGPMLGALSYR